MVENVESFSTEFESHLFSDWERSNDRRVEIDKSLASYKTTVRVPERVLRRNRECRGIKPLRRRPLKPGKGVAYHISTFIGVGVSDIGNVRGVDHGLVLPAAEGEDIVELPVAQDVVAEAVAGGKSLPRADRDFIKRVYSERLRHIGPSVSSRRFGVVRILHGQPFRVEQTVSCVK